MKGKASQPAYPKNTKNGETIGNYSWSLPGMRPLQVGLVLSVIATSLAGILSNPLFTLANNSIARTPMLQQALHTPAVTATTEVSVVPTFREN